MVWKPDHKIKGGKPGKKNMAFTGNTAWYVSSVNWSAVITWATGQAKSVGALVKQSGTPTVGNERVYVCIVAGTTGGGADPLTTFTRGVKITDNTVTWQECTGIPALNGDLTNTPNWTTVKNTAITLGHVIKDNAGTHIFICSTAGTAGNGAEPSWSVGALGNTTADNTATWTYIGTSFGAWAAPHARLQNALATNWGDTGTQFFLSSDHAETQTTALSLTARGSNTAPLLWLSVNKAGSVPPVSADLTAGAKISVTASTIVVNGHLRLCFGITFEASGAINTAGDVPEKFYDTCVWSMTGAALTLDTTGVVNAYVEMRACKIKLGSATSAWAPKGRVIFRDSDALFDSGGTLPNTCLNVSACILTISGVDLSALGGKALYSTTTNADLDITLINCKMPSSPMTMGNPTNASCRARVINCSGAAGSYSFEKHDGSGDLSTVINVARSGGASDGTTGFSWKINGFTNQTSDKLPCVSPGIAKWNANIDPTSVVCTLYGVVNNTIVPTNGELWVEFDYLGDASSPRTSKKSSKVADVLATAASYSADTSDWTAGATSRANGTVYAIGDVIKASSNSGRIFFCTVAGTSSGSLPAGYASAIDGGTVTDGTATFRAGCRFTMAVTLSSPKVQQAGIVYAKVKTNTPATTPAYYIDPLITFS